MHFNIFRNHQKSPEIFSSIDIHSHLLPGIDDGVQTLEESIEVISGFANMGYKKLITTPHIMGDFFKNTPTIINAKLAEVRNALKENEINIEIEAAAEYYLDEHFINLIDADAPLLTFADSYVLFETSFMSKPLYLKEVVFKLQTKGYRPVLAHPERYHYLHNDTALTQSLIDSGVLFQLNLNSVNGYYSRAIQNMAKKLIKANRISFIGSDCHNAQQLTAFKDALGHKMVKLLDANLILNNSL